MAPASGRTSRGGTEAAKSIMTTDTQMKEVAVQFEIGGKDRNHQAVCAKAPAMIHQICAPCFPFVTTDIAISGSFCGRPERGCERYL